MIDQLIQCACWECDHTRSGYIPYKMEYHTSAGGHDLSGWFLP